MTCENMTCHKMCSTVCNWGQAQAAATVMFTDTPKRLLEKNTVISFTNKSWDP